MVGIGVIILDQVTKFFILAYPSFYRTGEFFELFLTKNEGIAFSIPLSGTLLYVILIIVVGLAIYYGRSHLQLHAPLTGIVLGLIAGGGIGNIIDRIRLGYVADFIKLGNWPMFNIADAAITTGAILALLYHRRITIPAHKSA